MGRVVPLLCTGVAAVVVALAVPAGAQTVAPVSLPAVTVPPVSVPPVQVTTPPVTLGPVTVNPNLSADPSGGTATVDPGLGVGGVTLPDLSNAHADVTVPASEAPAPSEAPDRVGTGTPAGEEPAAPSLWNVFDPQRVFDAAVPTVAIATRSTAGSIEPSHSSVFTTIGHAAARFGPWFALLALAFVVRLVAGSALRERLRSHAT
jgi:hypothetical protein